MTENKSVALLNTHVPVRLMFFPLKNKERNVCGFTLIELLVAVLIIGILAAVAVPQYQKVQIRSKWAALKPFAQDLAQAEESYYLANGKYTVNLNELDIACTNCSQTSYTTYSTINLGGSNGKTWGNGKECLLFDTYVMCRTYHPFFQYKIYLQHSSSPNVRECVVAESDESTVRNQICKADTKSSTPYSTGTYTTWRYH